jgi:hypothetical protein
MAHGYKDYGSGAPKSTVYAVPDMGELAARLGSPVTFDRRGDLIWFDDFESGIDKWSCAGNGSNYSADWSAAAARSGAFSIRLRPGDSVGNLMNMQRHLPYPKLSKLGLEWSFTYDANLQFHTCTFAAYDGTNVKDGRLSYETSGGLWKYMDSAAAWQNMATGVTLYSALDCFHTVKLVIDFENSEYVRAILNSVEYDLANIAIRTAASSLYPHIVVTIVTYNGAGGTQQNYVDDVIITQNEP